MAVPCTYIIIKVTGKYHVIIFTTKAIFEVVNIHELLPHCNTKYLYQIQIFIQLQVLYTEGCNISTTCIEMQSHQIYFFFKLLFLKCILAECVGSGLLSLYVLFWERGFEGFMCGKSYKSDFCICMH